MNKNHQTFAFGILLSCILISGCKPSPQAVATATSVPPTETTIPTITPQPTAEPTETPASTLPLTSWNEVPIFPDAISGQDDMGDYKFTTKSPARIIIAYYQQEMVKLGWEIRGDMMAEQSSDLVFEKEDTFTFFLIKFDGENYTVYIHQVKN